MPPSFGIAPSAVEPTLPDYEDSSDCDSVAMKDVITMNVPTAIAKPMKGYAKENEGRASPSSLWPNQLLEEAHPASDIPKGSSEPAANLVDNFADDVSAIGQDNAMERDSTIQQALATLGLQHMDFVSFENLNEAIRDRAIANPYSTARLGHAYSTILQLQDGSGIWRDIAVKSGKLKRSIPHEDSEAKRAKRIFWDMPVDKTMPVEKPIPAEKPKRLWWDMPVDRPMLVEKPMPAEKPLPAEKPKRIWWDMPVEKDKSIIQTNDKKNGDQESENALSMGCSRLGDVTDEHSSVQSGNHSEAGRHKAYTNSYYPNMSDGCDPITGRVPGRYVWDTPNKSASEIDGRNFTSVVTTETPTPMISDPVPDDMNQSPRDFTVTYFATVQCGDKTVNIPINSNHVSGIEKTVINGGMKKVWKWSMEKNLGDKIRLHDAYDLAKKMHDDGYGNEVEGPAARNLWGFDVNEGSKRNNKKIQHVAQSSVYGRTTRSYSDTLGRDDWSSTSNSVADGH